MDPDMIRRHLGLAERHVLEGEEHIARQREIVNRLERRSPKSITLQTARELLQEMERAQRIHVEWGSGVVSPYLI
jgi:hypothetical protein